MKNIKFGVEIELGGESRKKASELIANYFGTESFFDGTYYNKWCARDRQGRKWTVMSDSSVCAGNESCEVVTPLLNYEDIEDLQEIVRILRKNGFKANDSCGIHVHVDNEGMTAKHIKNLVNLVNGHEELIYQALKIREHGRENWCKKTSQEFKKELNSMKNLSMDNIKKCWYQTQSYCSDGSSNHYDSSRYHLLNLHSMWQGKGIEFRCFNGTTHAGEIKAYIQFCLALVHRAKELPWSHARGNEQKDSLKAMKLYIRRLGLVGEEFETCRYHMTKNLSHTDTVEYYA